MARRGLGTALAAVLVGLAMAAPAGADSALDSDGLVRVRSAYPMQETVARLKQDVATKGIMMFGEIDQAKLAADVGITLRPSTLLVFGNPPLGTQFVTANPSAGLDWPVRLLVSQDEAGVVWATYTDFHWIARRHHITDRDAAFDKASEVIASITGSVQR
jgi:uncharacterized protein (DUF302 family)